MQMGDQVALWNLLHDGVIVGLQGAVPGDVTVEVEIAYLRSIFPEQGDRLRVLLASCSRLELHKTDGNSSAVTDRATIVAGELEILSAEQRDETVAVLVAQGGSNFAWLILQYESAQVSVESGRAVPLEEVAEASRRYWDRKGMGS